MCFGIYSGGFPISNCFGISLFTGISLSLFPLFWIDRYLLWALLKRIYYVVPLAHQQQQNSMLQTSVDFDAKPIDFLSMFSFAIVVGLYHEHTSFMMTTTQTHAQKHQRKKNRCHWECGHLFSTLNPFCRLYNGCLTHAPHSFAKHTLLSTYRIFFQH